MAIMNFAGTIMRNLFSRPATTMYPIVKKQYFSRTRGSIGIDIDSCIFCGLCMRKCPTGAIQTNKNEKLWNIERLKCIQCNCCVEVCPKKCLSMRNEYTAPSKGPVRDEYHARVSDNA
jgi:formate hydrogenlyase subunit 6/NADH:ubiquinone oxidoreductase subunit I